MYHMVSHKALDQFLDLGMHPPCTLFYVARSSAAPSHALVLQIAPTTASGIALTRWFGWGDPTVSRVQGFSICPTHCLRSNKSSFTIRGWGFWPLCNGFDHGFLDWFCSSCPWLMALSVHLSQGGLAPGPSSSARDVGSQHQLHEGRGPTLGWHSSNSGGKYIFMSSLRWLFGFGMLEEYCFGGRL